MEGFSQIVICTALLSTGFGMSQQSTSVTLIGWSVFKKRKVAAIFGNQWPPVLSLQNATVNIRMVSRGDNITSTLRNANTCAYGASTPCCMCTKQWMTSALKQQAGQLHRVCQGTPTNDTGIKHSQHLPPLTHQHSVCSLSAARAAALQAPRTNAEYVKGAGDRWWSQHAD